MQSQSLLPMSTNPYTPPTAEVADTGEPDLQYAGFWLRFLAMLIDSVLLAVVTAPILAAINRAGYFGSDSRELFAGSAELLVSWLLPAVVAIVFWVSQQATPGKMVFSMKVLDARTGKALSVGQSVGRYLGYYVSLLPFALGMFWVGFDSRKQGWHDKLAGTVVVRKRRGSLGTPVRFEG